VTYVDPINRQGAKSAKAQILFLVIESLESVELLSPIYSLNRQGAKDAIALRGLQKSSWLRIHRADSLCGLLSCENVEDALTCLAVPEGWLLTPPGSFG